MSQQAPNPFAPPESAPADMGYMAGGVTLARRLTRLVAAIVDALITLVVTVPLFMATGYMQGAMDGTITWVDQVIQLILGIVVFLALHGYLLATRGQSIGKFLFSIKIVDANSRQILPFGKLVGLRLLPVWIASSLPLVGGLFAMIDVLFIFSERRQCVHDLIAGTIVVEA